MAGIPQNFQAISNVLPTYNFVDIVAGTGYINFYAGKTVDKTILSNFTYYSDTVSSNSGLMFNKNNEIVQDIDFDVLVNRPMVLQGLGIVNVPFSISSVGGINVTINPVITLRKWTGSVETDIVSNNATAATTATSTYYMTGTDLVIPQTNFKVGEYIRLTVQVYMTDLGGGGTGGYSYIGHDPKSRTTGWDTTGAVPSQLIFQCPVRLNL